MKKVICLVLVFMLSFCFFACNNKDTNDSYTSQDSVVTYCIL